MPDELLFALDEVAVEALVELSAALYRERVLNRLPGELAKDVRRNVETKD